MAVTASKGLIMKKNKDAKSVEVLLKNRKSVTNSKYAWSAYHMRRVNYMM